ncbi:glycosyltransferase family 39 protein [Salinisphaera orenii]|uniref:glycosyltransferase family 39 protein n=1 Tax=Salinisphaera orenii TaxID=856731 RepID=UPI0011CE1090|nr:glycosyltransferase family 39 protein [Salinisphaera halophila]
MSKLIRPFLLFLLVTLLWLSVYHAYGFANRPAHGDELAYIARGVDLVEEGITALADGYRPPLFPFIVALLALLFDNKDLLINARLLNIIAMSLVPAIWFYAGSKAGEKKRISYYSMSFFTALWPPFYLYSFSAHAESLSFLFLNCLVYYLATRNFNFFRIENRIRTLTAIPLLLALLFYLKANNILISIPAALFLIFSPSTKSITARTSYVFIIALICFALISPWLVFLKSTTGQWNFTTTGGYNFLVGTGYYNFGMDADGRSVHEQYMQKLHGDYPRLPQDKTKELQNSNLSAAELDSLSKSIALQLWRDNTIQQIIFGQKKIFHSLGFSMRGMTDYVTAIFFISTCIISLLIIFSRIDKSIVFLHWGFALCGVLIAFFWLPNIRFKTFYFDTTAFLVISHFFQAIISRRNFYWSNGTRLTSP